MEEMVHGKVEFWSIWRNCEQSGSVESCGLPETSKNEVIRSYQLRESRLSFLVRGMYSLVHRSPPLFKHFRVCGPLQTVEDLCGREHNPRELMHRSALNLLTLSSLVEGKAIVASFNRQALLRDILRCSSYSNFGPVTCYSTVQLCAGT